MKINDLLLESTHPLYETVLPAYHREVMLGEELARTLTEAALTAQQIQALFAQVQQQATATGGNRTAIGKGVDAAKTVAKAYAGLKDLAQNSGPVKGFDAAFDKVAAELKQKTGGDEGAMKYVQKYRDFAKAHPIAQKVVYGALVMAVGVAAAGALGPAGIALKPAVIGLMRTTDKLLQGEKFSTAAIAGAETFAAGKIAQWAGQSIRNVMGGGAATPAPGGAADAAAGKITIRGAVDQLKEKFMNGEITDYPSYQQALRDVYANGSASGQMSLDMSQTTARLEKELGISFRGQYPDAITKDGAALMQKAGVPDKTGPGRYDNLPGATAGNVLDVPAEIKGDKALSAAYKGLVDKIQANPDYNIRNLPNDIQRFAAQNSAGGLQATKDATALSLLVQKQGGGNMRGFLDAVKGAAGSAREKVDFDKVDMSIPALTESQVMNMFAGTRFNRNLTESQVNQLFRHIEEGPFDAIKKAGAAIAGSRVGQAVKGAVTAAGQKIATGAENLTTKVTADKLNKAWQAAGSPIDSAAIYQFLKQQGVDDATLKAAFSAAKIKIPKASAAVSPQYKQVNSMITKLQPADRQRLIQYLQQQLGQQPATA